MKYNNNGNPIAKIDKENVTPIENTSKRRGIRLGALAIFLIITGLIISGATWTTYARGGSIQTIDGRPVVNITDDSEMITMNISETISNIHAQTGSMTIEIIPHSGSQIEITLPEDLRNAVSVERGTLRIETSHANIPPYVFNIGDNIQVSRPREIAITVRVPQNMNLRDVELNASIASIRIEGFEIENLNAQVNNGSIRLDNVTAPVLNTQANNGSIRLDNVTYQQLSARVSNGSIRAENMYPSPNSRANLQATNGSIRFDVNENIENFGYAVTTSSWGSARIDGNLLSGRNNHFNWSIVGGVGEPNNARHGIEARVSSGSININFNR